MFPIRMQDKSTKAEQTTIRPFTAAIASISQGSLARFSCLGSRDRLPQMLSYCSLVWMSLLSYGMRNQDQEMDVKPSGPHPLQ